MADRTVLFETGQAGQHFLEQAGVSCEFKVMHVSIFQILSHFLDINFLKVSIDCILSVLSRSWAFSKRRGAAGLRGVDHHSSPEILVEVLLQWDSHLHAVFVSLVNHHVQVVESFFVPFFLCTPLRIRLLENSFEKHLL